MKGKKAPIADLPRGVSVYPDGDTWRVRLGKTFTGGKVQKRRFDSVKEARVWIFGDAKAEQASPPPVLQQRQEGGTSSFELTPRQIAEAAAAVKRLGELGTLTEAVDFFVTHATPPGGETSVEAAVESYLRAKKSSGRSEKHLKGLNSIYEEFTETFGKQSIHLVKRTAVEEWLEELDVGPITRGNYIRDLKSLFTDAVRREWITTNPIEHLEKPKATPTPIRILTVPQVRRLMLVAEESYPSLAPALALKIFGGLRTSELMQLKWDNISKKEIEVGSEVAKTRQRRLVTIRPNLKSWLTTYRGSGPIWEGSQNQYHSTIEAAAKTAEISLSSNIFRHSYGSYLFAILKSEQQVSAEMGNSPKVVFSNYRSLVNRAAALAFWKIQTQKKPKNIVLMQSAA